MKHLAAFALAMALVVPVKAFATAGPKTAKTPTPDLISQAAALEANYDQIRRLFQKFAISVYAPYCKARGGLKTVGFSSSMNAWPAVIYCNADPKHPIHVEEPR